MAKKAKKAKAKKTKKAKAKKKIAISSGGDSARAAPHRIF